ncbi:MAG: peptidase S41, partial [Bacteroidota bacterium]
NPDIEITSQKTSDFTRSLIGNYAIFNYATEFYNQNSFASMNDFSLNDINYDAFKQSMAASGLDFYETNTERELKKIMSTKEADNFGKAVSKEYDDLLASIKQSKLDALDTYKSEIEVELQNEILKRYFYREGLYEYQLTHDEAIKKATQILANQSEYSSILN